jgi:hypothetical protein
LLTADFFLTNTILPLLQTNASHATGGAEPDGNQVIRNRFYQANLKTNPAWSSLAFKLYQF